MKNLITALVFVLAFTANANAQEAKKEVKSTCCTTQTACAENKTFAVSTKGSTTEKVCTPTGPCKTNDKNCKTNGSCGSDKTPKKKA